MTGRTWTIGDDPPPPRPDGLNPALAARIAGTDPGHLWGRVPRTVAMRVPTVRRGVRLISDAIGTMPLRRWRDGEEIPPGPMLTQPEAWRPYCRSVAAIVSDLILYPSAWWLVVARDAWTGYPTSVVRLDPDYVQVDVEPGSDVITREWATYRGRPVDPADLIHFDGPDEGLLTFGDQTILTALALEAAAARYASPEIPTGILKQTSQYELTDDEVDALLERWERSRRTRGTGWLNGGVDYQGVTTTPADFQLVESREESALQLCRHLGLPPRYAAVSSGDSLTYSTQLSERSDLIELCFAPYLSAIEERLSMSDRNGSPRGQSVRFSVTDFLRGAPLDRAERYARLLPLGVLTPQEARAEEGLTGPAPKPPAPAPPPAAAPPAPRETEAPS
ncbi:phage portal protein [Streptomyces sp. NPDC101490]|uniref:phage portal protein n=1 Tax=Streptomyces sp. NPDC101490 TaxID=3366143 RepID=UPI0038281715